MICPHPFLVRAGKVNPTQAEALTMVCCQVIGNDAAITAGGLQVGDAISLWWARLPIQNTLPSHIFPNSGPS